MTRPLSARAPWLVLLGTAPLWSACGGGSAPAPEGAPLWFVVQEGLVPARNRTGAPTKPFVTDSFGAGIALRDLDGDGHLDLFVIGGEAPDSLHLGRGDGTFAPSPAALPPADGSWSYGVNATDFDGDGDVDLYITRRGPNRLLRNRGDGTFDEVAQELGLADPSWSTGAVWLDHDRDGDLDLFVVNHIAFERAAVEAKGPSRFLDQEVYYGPTGLDGQQDRLYRAQADGAFVDATEAAGLVTAEPHYGFQALVLDEDGDGWLDLYVANDTTPNQLWRNRGDGSFEEVAGRLGCALSMEGGPQAGMGLALGDAQADGQPDLFVTNFSSDYFTLYQRGSDGFWRDRTTRARLHAPTWSSLGWACGFDDLDADGALDLWAFNGHVYPQMDAVTGGPGYAQRPLLFRGDGAGRFSAPDGDGGPAFAAAWSARGGCAGDVDEDGDLDLVMGVLDGSPVLLRNDSPQGGAVWLDLRAPGGLGEPLGARVEVTVEGRTAVVFHGAQGGFLSSGPRVLHLGLGGAARAEGVRVRWPDGSEQDLGPLDAGGRYRAEQGKPGVARVEGT
jgi:hypothetical protein